jgi:hypothetical protein
MSIKEFRASLDFLLRVQGEPLQGPLNLPPGGCSIDDERNDNGVSSAIPSFNDDSFDDDDNGCIDNSVALSVPNLVDDDVKRRRLGVVIVSSSSTRINGDAERNRCESSSSSSLTIVVLTRNKGSPLPCARIDNDRLTTADDDGNCSFGDDRLSSSVDAYDCVLWGERMSINDTNAVSEGKSFS